ncbi:MAG TPA: amylo-alpha-1,6-glucosidase, partial [bacterium]
FVNGNFLDRKQADSVKVYPDHVSRFYRKDIVESLYLLDQLNCLVIEISSPDLHSFDFSPLLPISFDLKMFKSKWHRNQDLFILSLIESNDPKVKPLPLGIRFDCTAQLNSKAKREIENSLPANQIGQFRIVKDHFRIYIVVANDEEEIIRLTENVMTNFIRLVDEKKKRLIKLLGDCHFETNLPGINKAFRWAVLSMDQLIMRQPAAGKSVFGIFAGLPWFNNYWGRDTFISLPGAALVRGNFDEAKEILLSYAQFQKNDPDNQDHGRIPNLITSDNIIYNTADGTPWFIRELWEYYQYSGDMSILESMYPVVTRAIDGTLKYHTDKFHFLTHGDAETWMDAQGTEGPWSPRGDRAVEIQALWFQQLLASSKIANVMGKREDAQNWSQLAEELKQNFQKNFWDHNRLALFDHLNSDGSADRQIRPNQIFTITVPGNALISPEQEFTVLKETIMQLTYPYGVASLWQHDPSFHPFHILPSYYPKDEAYHNGTVWGWLNGPVISSLMKYGYQNLAFELVKSQSYQILHWGAVGTLSELLNAIPEPGKELPAPSGTVSQAWSLAEYIRNIYQDLVGIHPDAAQKKITLAPHLPDEITSLTCCIVLPKTNIHLSMKQDDEQFSIFLEYVKGTERWDVDIQYLVKPNEKILFSFALQPQDTKVVKIEFAPSMIVSIDNKQVGYRLEKLPIRDELLSLISFAAPQLDKNLDYLKPPPYPLLSGSQVKSWNKKAGVLVEKSALELDDKGLNSKYLYPTSPYFKDGILDLTRFQLFADDKNYYFRLQFRDLVQPGWHPEYGFQLTFVAIAIEQGNEEPGGKFISRNANLRLPTNFAYQKIIFVGGGLQLEDAVGNIVAVYRPDDVRYPLGDIQHKEISFAIPKNLLGIYNKKWRFAIATGAQDDHGGGGIGEFRNVGITASDWQGGGGENETGNCNVYDLFIIN